MQLRRFAPSSAALSLALLLAACGGGGGSPGDTRPGDPPSAPPPAEGPRSFLLFPNPQVQADGTLQTDTLDYARSYYAAIDPNNERETLAKYKAKNGFDTGTGEQITVIFGDQRDLGYGRLMTVRRNVDGTIAFFVENYLVTQAQGYTYSPLNLEAAILRDTSRMVGVNAIEFTPGPNGGPPFPKFYNYEAGTGIRALAVDLDGQGLKAMPGPCITCHGGRGDALTPPDASGKRLFNLVTNGVSQQRGDVQARLHPFEPDVFGFSTRPGFTRADQEAAIKKINTWILCSYPIATPSSAPEDACRRPTGVTEWEGTQAALLKSSYGGDGLPNATWVDNYVPLDWERFGQATLYKNVVAPACRTCHSQRGVSAQSDIDFMSYEKFVGFADRIKAHIIDRGNMPLAKIVFDDFYGTNRHETLATFLEGQGFVARDASGKALRPGRPIANPGPDRVVRPGASKLSAADSLFSSTYNWAVLSGPGPATITNPTSAQATFNATVDGTYVVQLATGNGSAASVPAQMRIVVQAALEKDPADIRFADIKAFLQVESACVRCHSPDGNLPRPPVYYSQLDRNGDGMVNAVDDDWLYAEVRGRINFTEIAASPLLRKPANHHHSGGLQPGFLESLPPGSPQRAGFDMFQNWILNGAPQ